MTPHYHGPTFLLAVFLFVTVLYAAFHLAAISNPNNPVAKTWLSLGF